jgi:hypothetical protein
MSTITQSDIRRAKLALGFFRVFPALLNAVASHLATSRSEFAHHVGLTADEFGDDLEASACRLGELLQAQWNGEDPSTFDRFHAPDLEASDWKAP